MSMVGFFLVGICMSVGHHLYYHSLEGDQVGTESQQQWSLRFEPFIQPNFPGILLTVPHAYLTSKFQIRDSICVYYPSQSSSLGRDSIYAMALENFEANGDLD